MPKCNSTLTHRVLECSVTSGRQCERKVGKEGRQTQGLFTFNIPVLSGRFSGSGGNRARGTMWDEGLQLDCSQELCIQGRRVRKETADRQTDVEELLLKLMRGDTMFLSGASGLSRTDACCYSSTAAPLKHAIQGRQGKVE